jgi:hypothetical protein
MTEFLDFLLYAFIGWLIGRILMSFVMKFLEYRHEELNKEIEKIVKHFIFVKPEKHGDMIYLFEADTDMFVAQGRNMEELKQHCVKRFPDRNIVMSKEFAEEYKI